MKSSKTIQKKTSPLIKNNADYKISKKLSPALTSLITKLYLALRKINKIYLQTFLKLIR